MMNNELSGNSNLVITPISRTLYQQSGKHITEPVLQRINRNKTLAGEELIPCLNLNTICVSGKICKNRLCISDLLHVDINKINPANCFVTLMLCKSCYHDLYTDYTVLKEKINPIRTGSFFQDFVSVKINCMLNKIKHDCCGRAHCKVSNLTNDELDIAIKKFDSIYEAFAYESYGNQP